MPFFRLPKGVLAFLILSSLFFSWTNRTTASDHPPVPLSGSKILHFYPGSPADTSAWIDSLKRVIAKKYTWGSGGPAARQSQIRYIRANTTLADYYAKKFYSGDFKSLSLAEKYYGNVAILTSGTDGDLEDDISVIKLRDEGAKKLMRLYLSLKPDLVYRKKLYKLLRDNGGILRSETAATRDKVSTYVFKSKNRFFFETGLPKKDPGNEVTCFVNPFSSLSNKLTKEKMTLLDSFTTLMKAKPELRLKVTSLSSRFTMMEQQLLWEITNFVIAYLVERQGIASERFLFYYNMEADATNKYMGMEDLPLLTLGFAEEGEEGPSMVPPPLPNWRQ